MKKTNAARFLDSLKINYQLIAYKFDLSDLSVKNIAQANGLQEKLIFKTLVAKGDKTGIIVAVIPGDKILDFKLLALASKNKKVTLIPKSDLEKITGYIRGGCSPLAMKKNYSTFIDEQAFIREEIFLNAGSRGIFLLLKPKDLLQIKKMNSCLLCK